MSETTNILDIKINPPWVLVCAFSPLDKFKWQRYIWAQNGSTKKFSSRLWNRHLESHSKKKKKTAIRRQQKFIYKEFILARSSFFFFSVHRCFHLKFYIFAFSFFFFFKFLWKLRLTLTQVGAWHGFVWTKVDNNDEKKTLLVNCLSFSSTPWKIVPHCVIRETPGGITYKKFLRLVNG